MQPPSSEAVDHAIDMLFDLVSDTFMAVNKIKNKVIPKHKLWLPGHQISWVSEWLSMQFFSMS